MIGMNKCLSVKVCLFLTWLQSSWKPFEGYIQDGSEQEICFEVGLKVLLGLKYCHFRWELNYEYFGNWQYLIERYYSSLKKHFTLLWGITGMHISESWCVYSSAFRKHICIQGDLEASIPVWVPKLVAGKSFLVQYI